MIPISEIFYSLQGEGRSTGIPVIFVRFRGCDLKCGFCDSKYSREDKSDLQMRDIHRLLESIENFAEKNSCKHIIFTGGEPALFEKHIKSIQDYFGEEFFYEIETNGKHKLKNEYNQVNVSYKTSNSGNKKYELKALNPLYDYKFVVKDQKDLEEVEQLIKEFKIPGEIRLMPLGTDPKSQSNIVVINACLKNQYRYCQRMHILLFGNKKGV